MNRETIIRAWKDPEFRAGLTSEQREALPESPSGRPLTELDEAELVDVVGGALVIRPTPPISFTEPVCCIPQGSAYACGCPSAWLCPTPPLPAPQDA